MEERELLTDRDDEQTIGFAHGARDLREELRARDANGDGDSDPLAYRIPESGGEISDGVPAIRRRPPTSRNASSIERPSTSGVVSRNTSNIALLASEYASIRGGTTMAWGQRRRAWVSPIGVRTPKALAS